MFDKELFENSPRCYASDLVSDGVITHDYLISMALKYMSHDQVRDMLDCNELSPRFNEEGEEE